MRISASSAAVAAFAALILQACVTTKEPAIAHVHIGHATAGWPDTPGKRGLFVIAEEDARTAAEQAALAASGGSDLESVQKHAADVGFALDPGGRSQGAGSGYGFLRALGGARDHILYAAESKDASDNIKAAAPAWASLADQVLEQGQLASALALEVAQLSSAADAVPLSEELAAITVQIRDGADTDSSGVIGDAPGEVGMRQLREELEAMIGREEPPYQPVARKYLFGLVRLPSGEWVFQTGKSGSGYGSYRY